MLAASVLGTLATGCGDDGGSTAAPSGEAAEESVGSDSEKSGSERSGSEKSDDEDFSGYVRDPAPDVGSVTLPGADGAPVSLEAPPGGLRLVYFGYTYCPDVCPTTMSDVKRAVAMLPVEPRDLVEVDMITIDPARDTVEKLTDYVTTFVPDGRALRTEDQAQLRAAADAFGADYSVEVRDGAEPEVSHTAELYAVDDTGHVVMIWPFGTTYRDIGEDLERLLAGERPQDAASASSSTPSTAAP